MSLNNTPLTEVHRDVLNCAQIVISTADLINSFPILAPNGNITNPTYSFASNTDTGLFRTTDGVSVAVDAQVGLVAAGDGNVALGDTPTDYGGGQGVVFFSDAAVTPVGVPNGGTGGILYTEGQELQFLDSTGNVTSITTAGGSDVTAPDTSLANQLATFSSPSGNIITRLHIPGQHRHVSIRNRPEVQRGGIQCCHIQCDCRVFRNTPCIRFPRVCRKPHLRIHIFHILGRLLRCGSRPAQLQRREWTGRGGKRHTECRSWGNTRFVRHRRRRGVVHTHRNNRSRWCTQWRFRWSALRNFRRD
jgi:hypothetical protein